jgi:hypothetical protein
VENPLKNTLHQHCPKNSPAKKTTTGSQNQTNHTSTKQHISHAKILAAEKILGLAG